MNSLEKAIEEGKSVDGLVMLFKYGGHSKYFFWTRVKVKGLISWSVIMAEVVPIEGVGSMIVEPRHLLDDNEKSIDQYRRWHKNEQELYEITWCRSCADRRSMVVALVSSLTTAQIEEVGKRLKIDPNDVIPNIKRFNKHSIIKYAEVACKIKNGIDDDFTC